MGHLEHSRDIKLIPIGNSQGIRLPKTLLEKYGIEDHLILEEISEGILLHKTAEKKWGWKRTFQAMAHEAEDWSDFDDTIADGLSDNDGS